MVGGGQKETKLPLGPTMLCSGLGGSIAEVLTLPFDTVKVRLMLYPQYRNMMDCAKSIVVENPLSLWAGLTAGIHRQMVYCSLRVSLFYALSDTVTGSTPENPKETTLLQKIGLGLLTGGIAISIANPTEVVKIRIQGDLKNKGQAPRYSGTMNAYSSILTQEGLAAFWTGVGPNIVRNSVINAAELATYAQLKEFILSRKLMQDSLPCHFLCGFLAGFAAVVFGNPVDLVKNRIINAKPGQFNGVIDCVMQTLRNERIMSFYSGFVPNVLRIGTWNMVMFVAFEQLKKAWKTKFIDE